MEPPEYWEDERYCLVPSQVHGTSENPMGVHLCKSCGGVAFDKGVHNKWHERIDFTVQAVGHVETVKFERKW